MKNFDLTKYLAEGRLLKEDKENGYILYTTNVEYDNGKTGYMYQLVNAEDRKENEIGFDQLYFDSDDNRLEVRVDFDDVELGSYQEEKVDSKEEAEKIYQELKEDQLNETGGYEAFVDNEDELGDMGLDGVERFGVKLAKAKFDNNDPKQSAFYNEFMAAWKEGGYDDLEENDEGNDIYQVIKNNMKSYYKLDVDMDTIKDWADNYFADGSPYGEGDIAFDTGEREDFLTDLKAEKPELFPNPPTRDDRGYKIDKDGKRLDESVTFPMWDIIK